MSPDTLKLRKAWRFFMENAGYSSPPGRAACALSLARAEAEAKRRGFVARWAETADEWDGEGPRPEGCAEFCAVYSTEECRHCQAMPQWPIATLSGIWGADADYRRVVEAELFSEALSQG